MNDDKHKQKLQHHNDGNGSKRKGRLQERKKNKKNKGMVSMTLNKQHQICRRITTKVEEATTLEDLGNPKLREEGSGANSQRLSIFIFPC